MLRKISLFEEANGRAVGKVKTQNAPKIKCYSKSYWKSASMDTPSTI